MSSSSSDIHISISSETIGSPEKSTDFEDPKCPKSSENEKVIVISDTELEEGEIDDEDDNDNNEDTKSVDKKEDESDHVDLRDVIDKKKLRKSAEELYVDYDSNSKRKLNTEGNHEVCKKSKLETTPLGNSFEDQEFVNEFSWSELNVLMVGDERVIALNWEEWEDFPSQELFHLPYCNLSSLCTFVEKHLHKEYDVVFVFAFHHDFICFLENTTSEVADKENSLIGLREDVNISELIKTVQRYHYKWVRQYPNTNIIWTLPSPPDFYKFNSIMLKEKGINPVEQLNRKQQNELSKDYFDLSRKLAKEWRMYLKYIPMFPLNKVLFMKKHCYKRTFIESGSPKFPRGFLSKGHYPTKMMAIYCAYLLVEYLIDEGFYPENKIGLDLREAETKLVELEPDAKSYLFANDQGGSSSFSSSRHDRSARHYPPKHSPQRSPHRSRSRSRSKRNWSSSRHHHKVRPRSRQSRRSRSTSKEGRRKSFNKSRAKHKPKQSSHSQRRSCSSSTSRSSQELEAKNVDGAESPGSKIEISNELNEGNKVKDEVSFWKTLRYLRQVHDIQCEVFRRNPQAHPQYNDERKKFISKFEHRSTDGEVDLGGSGSRWNEIWKQRMEEIFEENWAAKKQQLTIDLSKKGTFTSLNAFIEEEREKSSRSKRGNENKGDSANVQNERSQFRKENVETIKSYLDEFQSTIESLESSSQERAHILKENKDKTDFTLADIFKDSPSKEQLSEDSRDEPARLIINEGCHIEQTPALPRDMTPPFDSKGEDSFGDSDSDMDLDGLMQNPDFLQGLDEIDKELNAVPSETAEKEPPPTKPAPIKDLAAIFTSEVNKQKTFNEDIKVEFVNVLKMLFRVSKRLGPLGLSVSALYLRASEDLRNKKERFSSLNSESKSLLMLVDKRLNILLKDNLPQVQKAIYGEISERLQALLGKMNVEHDKFSKVNIHNIAVATLGQEVAGVVSFIKNTLLYHGYTQFTSDDVMNIYMSVKATQLDMEKS